MNKFLLVFSIIIGLLIFSSLFYYFFLYNKPISSDLPVDHYFPSKRISTFTDKEENSWVYRAFVAKFDGYGEKNGIKYIKITYLGPDETFLESKIYYSGISDTPDYIKKTYEKKVAFDYDLYLNGCIPYKDAGFNDEEPTECLTLAEKLPDETFITFAILEKFPSTEVRTYEYCVNSANAYNCALAELYSKYFPNLSDFWNGSVIDESNLIFPLFISMNIPE